MANGQCGQRCEVYSRIVGYYRPVEQWNVGKKEEFYNRVVYDLGRLMPIGASYNADAMHGLRDNV